MKYCFLLLDPHYSLGKPKFGEYESVDAYFASPRVSLLVLRTSRSTFTVNFTLCLVGLFAPRSHCYIITVACVPYRSIQHFVWPLHWCLLADICNHTWIPECGTDDPDSIYRRRLFVDECDMYEYNCDNVRDYVLINYSDCFNIPPSTTHCPTIVCPECPTLSAHRRHDPHSKRTVFRTPGIKLPKHMLKGMRRYTPRPRNRRIMGSPAIMRTVILKKEEMVVNGKKVMKIVKGFIEKRKAVSDKETKDSDYIDN